MNRGQKLVHKKITFIEESNRRVKELERQIKKEKEFLEYELQRMRTNRFILLIMEDNNLDYMSALMYHKYHKPIQNAFEIYEGSLMKRVKFHKDERWTGGTFTVPFSNKENDE